MNAKSGYDTGTLNTMSANELLQELELQGILDLSDVQKIRNMKKYKKVDEVHEYKIWQGKGKDKRFFTYIPDENSKCGRRKIAKLTQASLYETLYELYFGDQARYENCTLEEIYDEWLNYKNTLANRSNYARRIDNDYQKYYVNELLSEKIISTPLNSLSKIDLEMWAYAIIKKYNLTKKAYYNMSIIIRQIYIYLIDKEVLLNSPFEKVKIPSTSFRKVKKPKAETQIFYKDELDAVIAKAYELATEKKDENYLAIPLIFNSGIRLGECLGLKFEDFSKEENQVYIHQSFVAVEGKNSDGTWKTRAYEVVDSLKHNAEPREVLITDKCFELVDEIKRLKREIGKEHEEYLFTVQTPAEIEYKLYSICEKLDYLRRSTHKIRKTYISSLINGKVDVDFVREQVGHQDLKTTFGSYTFSTTRRDENLSKINEISA